MSRWRIESSRVVFGAPFVAAIASTATAGVVAVDASYFTGGTVVTFSEVAVDTPVPFTIGIAEFTASGGVVTDAGAGSDAAPPAPSGGAYLFTGSVGNDDWIEVILGKPQRAVGAYFNIQGAAGSSGDLQMELYDGDTLLGVIAAIADGGTWGGFVGAEAGDTIIDRVIFRDIDRSTPISFRIDDFQFIPAPGGALLLAAAAVASRRRRNAERG